MELILKHDETVLATIPLEYDMFDNIVFGTEKVKEIAFTKDINNSDEMKLEPLYNELMKVSNYKDCNTMIMFYDREHYFKFTVPLKDIYYRVLSYP